MTSTSGGGKVSVKDRGLTMVVARLHRASLGATLSVGINEAEGGATHEGTDLTIAEIGELHEFGFEDPDKGINIPRRSFIADWSDEGEERHRAQIRKVAAAVVKGKIDSWETGLNRLGVLYVAEIQRRIAQGIDPPLSQHTIDRKGSSVPLIDKGILRTSITFVIIK